MEPEIIYQDKNFLALNKPAGLLVHPTLSIRKELTLVDWLRVHYPEVATVGDEPRLRPGIVHRLDRDTSGLILIPRTQAYFEYLKNLFQTHAIKKTYLAVVFGAPAAPNGRIDRPIGLKDGTTKRSLYSTKMQKTAVTNYALKETFEREGQKFSLLEVAPETGRTHQIRVHLAGISCPIVGDRLYGAKIQPAWATRLMLHAFALEFSPQPGQSIKLVTEPPPEFALPPVR